MNFDELSSISHMFSCIYVIFFPEITLLIQAACKDKPLFSQLIVLLLSMYFNKF